MVLFFFPPFPSREVTAILMMLRWEYKLLKALRRICAQIFYGRSLVNLSDHIGDTIWMKETEKQRKLAEGKDVRLGNPDLPLFKATKSLDRTHWVTGSISGAAEANFFWFQLFPPWRVSLNFCHSNTSQNITLLSNIWKNKGCLKMFWWPLNHRINGFQDKTKSK